MAPAGVSKDIIARLNSSIVKAAGTPEMRETFTRQGLDPQTNTPEQFAAFIHSELVQTAKLIKASGAQAN
jgi:tripartite-type tricarboxylate transporter receptor subunit TctC